MCLIGLVLMGANGCSSNPYVEGAKLDINNEDYDRALESLNKAIEQEPQNAEAYKLKGDVYATKAFEAGVSIDSFRTFYGNAMDAYDKALEYDPELADEIQNARRFAYLKAMQSGMKEFKQGQNDDAAYVEAATYFQAAGRAQPDSVAAFENEAYALLNAGQQQAAIEPFEATVEAGVERPQPYIYLSQLYASQDRLEDAVTLLEEAQERFPENEEVQAQLLNTYVTAGMSEEALSQYEAAVEANPDNALYRVNYGTLLLEMGRLEEAITQLERATDLDAENADAFYNLGAAYANQAVAANDRIGMLNDSLRANQDDLSQADQEEINQELLELDEVRQTKFQAAIGPLEQARELAMASGSSTQGICQALFQAYVQTAQEDKAQSVSACAGYEE